MFDTRVFRTEIMFPNLLKLMIDLNFFIRCFFFQSLQLMGTVGPLNVMRECRGITEELCPRTPPTMIGWPHKMGDVCNTAKKTFEVVQKIAQKAT